MIAVFMGCYYLFYGLIGNDGFKMHRISINVVCTYYYPVVL